MCKPLPYGGNLFYCFVLKGWTNKKTPKTKLSTALPLCGSRCDTTCLEYTEDDGGEMEWCAKCFREELHLLGFAKHFSLAVC